MEEIIQQIGKQFIVDFATGNDDDELSPEEWIDSSILGCFIDPLRYHWWNSEDTNVEVEYLGEEDITEMNEYLENNNCPSVVSQYDLELNDDSPFDLNTGHLLINYGYYKAKQYRDYWIEQLIGN